VIWVIVLAAIGLAGLLMVAGYAVWLAHKMSDLLAELKVLGQRGGQLARTVGQIAPPDRSHAAGGGLAASSPGRDHANEAVVADPGGTGEDGGLATSDVDVPQRPRHGQPAQRLRNETKS
jgi:hypothetical protein